MDKIPLKLRSASEGFSGKILLTLFFTIYTETDMELKNEMIEQLKADLAGAITYSDLIDKDGAIKNLLAKSIEQMLDSKLSDQQRHLAEIFNLL